MAATRTRRDGSQVQILTGWVSLDTHAQLRALVAAGAAKDRQAAIELAVAQAFRRQFGPVTVDLSAVEDLEGVA